MKNEIFQRKLSEIFGFFHIYAPNYIYFQKIYNASGDNFFCHAAGSKGVCMELQLWSKKNFLSPI